MELEELKLVGFSFYKFLVYCALVAHDMDRTKEMRTKPSIRRSTMSCTVPLPRSTISSTLCCKVVSNGWTTLYTNSIPLCKPETRTHPLPMFSRKSKRHPPALQNFQLHSTILLRMDRTAHTQKSSGRSACSLDL